MRFRIFVSAIGLFVAGLGVVGSDTGRLHAATITVNSVADITADDGQCTLREAIVAINTNTASGSLASECAAGEPAPTVDVIEFGITGPSIPAIQPTSALDVIVEPVFINGYSQPGSSPNTQTIGNDAVLLIEIDGSNAGVTPVGLWFNGASDNSELRGIVVHSFQGSGIAVYTDGVTVAGNFVGTDRTGTQDLGNAGGGIRPIVSASNATIGGPVPADRNLVSGNQNNGIDLAGPGHVVINNYIGTDASGTVAIPNLQGISANSATDAQIGAPGLGNLVSGHTVTPNAAGISITGSSDDVRIVDNLVGTDASGQNPLPNSHGVEVVPTCCTTPISAEIGTVDGGNLIAFNNLSGVRVWTANDLIPHSVRIQRNSIHSNGALGIDLADDGITFNDPLDPDDGPNSLQNRPFLGSAIDDANLEIQWLLDSSPASDYSLEFFYSEACDPSGSGEGEVFLGETMASTDVNGTTDGLLSLPSFGLEGFITATATDLEESETSEFSTCVPIRIVGRPPQDIPTLGEYGLMLFVLLLSLASARVLRTRRTVVT